jgi:hypothetical protein
VTATALNGKCFLNTGETDLTGIDAEIKGPTRVEDVVNWETVIEKYLSIQGRQINESDEAVE